MSELEEQAVVEAALGTRFPDQAEVRCRVCGESGWWVACIDTPNCRSRIGCETVKGGTHVWVLASEYVPSRGRCVLI